MGLYPVEASFVRQCLAFLCCSSASDDADENLVQASSKNYDGGVFRVSQQQTRYELTPFYPPSTGLGSREQPLHIGAYPPCLMEVTESLASPKQSKFDDGSIIDHHALLGQANCHRSMKLASVSVPTPHQPAKPRESHRDLLPLPLGPVVLKDLPQATPETHESPYPPGNDPLNAHSYSIEQFDRTVSSSTDNKPLERCTKPEFNVSPPPFHGRIQETCLQRPADKPGFKLRCNSTPSSLNTKTQLECGQGGSNLLLPPLLETAPVEQGRDDWKQSPARLPSQSGSSEDSVEHTALTSVSPVRQKAPERERGERKVFEPLARKQAAKDEGIAGNVEIHALDAKVGMRRQEMRRAESPSHIPAIAPSMRVRARPETLNDVGSALARPQTAHEPVLARHIFDEHEQEWSQMHTSQTQTRFSSRMSGWLSTLSRSQSRQAPRQEPFYRLVLASRPRARSEASLCAEPSVTELGSPSLTAASSPTSRCHSRSVTGTSQISPVSPPSKTYFPGHIDTCEETDAQWPMPMPSTSQVGVAL